MTIGTVLLVWVGIAGPLAVLTYGLSLAYWQRKWPRIAHDDYEEDVGRSLFFSLLVLLCPPAFIVPAAYTKLGVVYGLKFR